MPKLFRSTEHSAVDNLSGFRRVKRFDTGGQVSGNSLFKSLGACVGFQPFLCQPGITNNLPVTLFQSLEQFSQMTLRR